MPHSGPRPLSHGLGLVVAGLRSLWPASWLKPWLKATRGLRQLMAASHGLQHHGNLVQITNLINCRIQHQIQMELGLHPCSLCCDWTQLAPNCIFTLLCSHFIWCFSESFLDWHILACIPVNYSCSFTGVSFLRSTCHKSYCNDSFEVPFVSGDKLRCICLFRYRPTIIEEHISKTQSTLRTE